MSARWPSLPTGRTLVMGILNVTPDSFSDGGEHLDPEAAVAHGLALVRDGADLVDVGGESTRPGAEPVDPAQERRRILPVIRRLTERGVVVSVDTLHPDTAEAALQAGAGIVNDVSGARLGEEMIELIARTGAPYILTHARGDSATMDSLARYADPVAEVRAELLPADGQLDLDANAYVQAPGRFKVVAYDYGVKTNILRMLADRGCEVTVVTAQTPAADVLAMQPDGIFLSNGPGDPATALAAAVASIWTRISATTAPVTCRQTPNRE